MFLLISLQLTLLASAVLCENYPYDEVMQTTEEDSRFLIIKLMDELFSYAEESVTQLVTNLVTIVKHFDTSVQFIFDSFSAIIDVSIRSPAYIVTSVLYAISWIIDMFVYLVLDLAYLYLIKGTFLYAKWNLIGLLYIITDLIYYTLHILLYLLKTFVITYLNIFTSIFVYIITPFFQSVFWALSFVTVGYFTLWVVAEVWMKIKESRDGGNSDDFFLVLILLPLAYVLYSIWFVFCSFIFNFICYPIMIFLYCCLVGFVTFYVGAEIFDKCQHYIRTFDKAAVLDLLYNALAKPILLAFGVDADDSRKTEQEQTELVVDSEYTEVECIVCFEERQLVKLLPCNHKIMCYNCTIRILENDYRCPVCRATIYSYRTDQRGFE